MEMNWFPCQLTQFCPVSTKLWASCEKEKVWSHFYLDDFYALYFFKIKTDKIIQLIKGKNFRYWLAVIALKKIWFYERQLHGSVTGINYVDDSIECLSPSHAVKLTFSYLNLSDILIYAKCNVCWVSYICYHVLNAPNRF